MKIQVTQHIQDLKATVDFALLVDAIPRVGEWVAYGPDKWDAGGEVCSVTWQCAAGLKTPCIHHVTVDLEDRDIQVHADAFQATRESFAADLEAWGAKVRLWRRVMMKNTATQETMEIDNDPSLD